MVVSTDRDAYLIPPASNPLQYHQNVVVMRHGDRLDNVLPLWAASATRPWNPPLADNGLLRAYQTGLKLRNRLDFPIHRVFVSPFLRCLETAAEVVTALCAVATTNFDDTINVSSQGVVIDPSQIKVSVEYGLSEMMNSRAIRAAVAPKDGKFSFDISECESVLPTGTVDKTFNLVYKELPQWQETAISARARYLDVIKTLADRYPSENLLMVTHGEGVGACLSGYLQNVTIREVEYCAYSVLHRLIDLGENNSFTAEEFVGSAEDLDGIVLAEASK